MKMRIFLFLLAFVFESRLAAQPCAPLPAGCIAWWPGEDNNKSLLSEDTAVGGSYGAGKVGRAFQFYGNNFATVADGRYMSPASITVEGWFNIVQDSKNGAALASTYSVTGNGGWSLVLGEAQHPVFNVFRGGSFGQVKATNAIPLNTWVHIAGSYDGTNVSVYVNGQLQGSTVFAGGYAPATGAMLIGAASWCESYGCNGYDFHLNGSVDELSIYNRALSSVEIQGIYSAGSNGKCLTDATLTHAVLQFAGGISGYHNSGGQIATVPFYVAGTNTLLVVGWGHDNDGKVNSITFDNAPLASIGTQPFTNDQGDHLNVGLYYLLNPHPGQHNLIFTRNIGNATMDYTVGLYTGVEQTAVDASIVGSVSSGATPSTSLTTKTNDCWVIGSVYSGPPTAILASGSHTFFREKSPDQVTLLDSNGTLPAGPVPLSWSISRSAPSAWVFASFRSTYRAIGILTAPRDTEALLGSNVTFTIMPTGKPPFSYQWYLNGIANPLLGETNSSLTLTNVALSNVGNYSVSVMNSEGSVLSSSAFLKVLDTASPFGDGIPNWWKAFYALSLDDPNLGASVRSGERLTYTQKFVFGLNPTRPDTDGDGLEDFDELFAYGTDPLRTDTDGDGMPDGWESSHGLNPLVNDASGDFDLDGLTNKEEFDHGTDPRSVFTNGRSIADFEFVKGIRPENHFYYDGVDRLIGAEYGNGSSIAYRYDANGNLTNQLRLVRPAVATSEIPMLWKVLHGLAGSGPGNGDFDDLDGDGWANYQEWKTSTDPQRALSSPPERSNPGVRIGSVSFPFNPTRFILATGELDNGVASRIAVSADGNPGTNSNFVVLFSRGPKGWTSENIPVGSIGVTSLEVARLTNRPSPAIYVGTRASQGAGKALEFVMNGSAWQSNLMATATGDSALIVGVQPDAVLISYETQGGTGLYSVVPRTNGWTSTLLRTNGAHRAIGTTADFSTGAGMIRLLDEGQIEVTRGKLPPADFITRPDANLSYSLNSKAMTWTEAEDYAQTLGGHLATILNAADQAWLQATYQSTGTFWIGLSRLDCQSQWQWSSGGLFNYANWAPGEPNCAAGRERFAGMFWTPDGKWNDFEPINVLPSVIEIRQSSIPKLDEPSVSHRLLSFGEALLGSHLRIDRTNEDSVFYAYIEDVDGNGIVNRGDTFSVAEYMVGQTNAMLLNLQRIPLSFPSPGVHYGMAGLRANTSGSALVLAEPNGEISAFVTAPGSSVLTRSLLSGSHLGGRWEAIARVRETEHDEGLVGLLLDDNSSTSCQVWYWDPSATKTVDATTLSETAPIARVLPPSAILGRTATLTMRIWDGEGNRSAPFLQYQLPASTNWQNATLAALDGFAYKKETKLSALPIGVNHSLAWDAVADLGESVATNILLRACAQDFLLTGEWSQPLPVAVNTTAPADSDADGLPDAWEMQKFGNLNQTGDGDFDGDGFSNRAEYLAGSDPKNPASNLSLTITIEGSQVAIQWRTSRAAPQLLEATVDITGTNWIQLTTQPASAEELTSFSTPLTNKVQFFRVRLE